MIHADGFRTTPPVPPEWVSTTTETQFFTEEMIRRAMGQQPCDMQDVPFCGWGDVLTEENRDE